MSCSSTRRLSFDLSLYLVANRPSYPDEHLFFSKIMQAVAGGASCVQLRDHTNTLAFTIQTARRLKEMLGDIPLFINTCHSVDVAQEVNAAGVYLEEPFSYHDARLALGNQAVIGIPVKTMQQVLAAEETSAIDYLSVKVSPSKKTCLDNDCVWGVDGLTRVREASSHRIVAIGGLTVANVLPVYRSLSTRDGVAMAGGLMDQMHPEVTARKILSLGGRV